MKKSALSKLERKSKERQNVEAVNAATKYEDHFYYEFSKPLVINDKCKILEIFIREDEEEEYSPFNDEKTVRIIFKEKDEEIKRSNYIIGNRVPYTMDIRTNLSLFDFEDELIKCESEEDIEDLNLDY